MKKFHQIIHEGHKDRKCESSSYFQAGDLKKNFNIIHEGHKDYKCESCGKSYSDEQNLKKYIYTAHTNLTKTQSLPVEKYKCEICKHNFSSKCNLKVHIENVHEGLKRFKCDKCAQKFTEKKY